MTSRRRRRGSELSRRRRGVVSRGRRGRGRADAAEGSRRRRGVGPRGVVASTPRSGGVRHFFRLGGAVAPAPRSGRDDTARFVIRIYFVLVVAIFNIRPR